MTRSASIARNTLWNLAGTALPLVVAIFAIPVLIRGLGTERFGVLMLAWAIMGHFALFDFGLGLATNKFVSKLHEPRARGGPAAGVAHGAYRAGARRRRAPRAHDALAHGKFFLDSTRSPS